ncbi:MAG: GHKL domain-containing protein [Clostridium sp.]
MITFIIIIPLKSSKTIENDDFRKIVISVAKECNNDKERIKEELLNKINDSSISDRKKGSYYVSYIVYNLVFPNFEEIKRVSDETEKILVKENMSVHLSYYYFYLAFMYSQTYDYNKSYVNIYKANELAGELYSKNKSNYVIELLTASKYLQASIEGDLELNDMAKRTFEEAQSLEKEYNTNNYLDTINSKIKYHLYEKDYKKVIELSLDLKNKMDKKNKIEILYFFNDMYLSEAYINTNNLKKAEDILALYPDKALKKNEVSYKYRIIGDLEEAKGNYEKALKIRKKEYKYLDNTMNYRGQLLDLEKILDLCKLTGNKNEMIFWINKYRECVKKVSSLKGTQYLIGSLGDIELQNTKYNNKILELESKNLTYVIIIIFIISILVIIIIAIANRNKRIKNEILASNIDVLSSQLNNQYEHYNNIKEYQEEVRRLWHDMKHHTNLLNTLLEKGEYEECKKYLSSMSNTIDLNRSKSLTKHSILDAILVNKEKICKNRNIKLLLDIKVPDDLNIDNFDLCVIYKNLLDNAIEACLNLEDKEKYISVKSMLMNKYLYIEVLNSKSNKVVKANGKFISSKNDGKLHGLGIASVKRSVEKYDGNIKFEYNNEWFKVTALIKNEIKQ